jgi:hypothetical protein
MRIRDKDFIQMEWKQDHQQIPSWIKWSFCLLGVLLCLNILYSFYSFYTGNASPGLVSYYCLYVAISFIYSMSWREKEKSQVFIRFLFLILFPVIGLLYSLVSDFQKKEKKEQNPFGELNNIFSFKDMGVVFYKQIDMHEDQNIVPLEEAILLGNVGTKRKLLINALKGDLLDNLDILNAALEDKDTETSHYASSAILQIRGKLMLTLQELDVKYEKNKGLEVLWSYASALKKCLASKVLDSKAHRKYEYIYVQVLEEILIEDQSNASYFEEKINYEIKLKNYDQAKRYCSLFHQYFPMSELPFFISMKLFYETGNKKELLEELNRLKESPIKLSHQGLLKLRFWDQSKMFSKQNV